MIKKRFRGFLPVVVDVETAGVDASKHAVLEICVVLLKYTQDKKLEVGASSFEHVLPFEGALLDPESLAFNGIDPFQPLRGAVDEKQALTRLFAPIWEAIKATQCTRAVLVGHNAWFDLAFINAAAERAGVKSPFHRFTSFDTATLSGVHYGQTVLAKAMKAANIAFDANEAHSAIYDAEKTAALFCEIINTWQPFK
ncbi:MAG: ribonuclease T [Legionellaceae bacterium]|nr:ribonuclease T [Legionellaceae bacterium]